MSDTYISYEITQNLFEEIYLFELPKDNNAIANKFFKTFKKFLDNINFNLNLNLTTTQENEKKMKYMTNFIFNYRTNNKSILYSEDSFKIFGMKLDEAYKNFQNKGNSLCYVDDYDNKEDAFIHINDYQKH